MSASSARSARCRAAAFAAFSLILGPIAPAAAQGLTTAELILQSVRPDCLNWIVIGLCFWLHCHFGCYVQTSILVRHYNPALVVTTPNALGASPWVEAAVAYGPLQVAAHQEAWAAFLPLPQLLQTGDSNDWAVDSLTHTRAGEAIGHPGNPLSMFGELTEVICPLVDVAPFYPYFLAGLDTLAWYGGFTEAIYPQSWIPGLNEIGPWPLQTWGSVYPRIGQITHPENPKTAAVIAQRVADIVTRPLQPHVYTQVGMVPGRPSGNMLVWPPVEPVVENNPLTHLWQMLRPVPGPCEVFGAPDAEMPSLVGWSSGKDAPTGDYAFNLWRPYECCARRQGAFIGRVP